MSRRSTLPGAAELFRSTGARADQEPSTPTTDQDGVTPAATTSSSSEPSTPPAGAPTPAAVPDRTVGTDGETTPRSSRRSGDRRPSGRERHDEKITVYVSPAELLDLEHARLTLRGEHGLAVDRGRIVREALAVVIADLEAKGDDSIIVRRLVGR